MQAGSDKWFRWFASRLRQVVLLRLCWYAGRLRQSGFAGMQAGSDKWFVCGHTSRLPQVVLLVCTPAPSSGFAGMRAGLGKWFCLGFASLQSGSDTWFGWHASRLRQVVLLRLYWYAGRLRQVVVLVCKPAPINVFCYCPSRLLCKCTPALTSYCAGMQAGSDKVVLLVCKPAPITVFATV